MSKRAVIAENGNVILVSNVGKSRWKEQCSWFSGKKIFRKSILGSAIKDTYKDKETN